VDNVFQRWLIIPDNIMATISTVLSVQRTKLMQARENYDKIRR